MEGNWPRRGSRIETSHEAKIKKQNVYIRSVLGCFQSPKCCSYLNFELQCKWYLSAKYIAHRPRHFESVVFRGINVKLRTLRGRRLIIIVDVASSYKLSASRLDPIPRPASLSMIDASLSYEEREWLVVCKLSHHSQLSQSSVAETSERTCLLNSTWSRDLHAVTDKYISSWFF